jgi:hypothetical protein
MVTPEEERGIRKFIAACNRAGAFAPALPSHAIAPGRFQRGLLLLSWINSTGGGKLTKKLVGDVARGCNDWPEVRASKSGERLRNALRNLADDVRGALRDRRLPRGWRT